MFIQAEGARLAFDRLDSGVGCDQSGKYHLGATPRIEAHWQDSTRLVFHTAVFSIPARKGRSDFHEQTVAHLLGEGDLLAVVRCGYTAVKDFFFQHF